MINLALNTYTHLLFILTIFCTLIAELILLRKSITGKSLNLLSKVDGMYGLAAIMVVGTGLLNWFLFGKGSTYYSGNTLFLIKISLFVIVGLLSIYPTIMIARAKKRMKLQGLREVELHNVRKIRNFIKAELVIMAIIPLLAELMANGIDI
ncbi:DUF2214 family protein [Ekhidna sp.]|uniref:DUF2214 family protein n=1 Tax=Ekhidna sp. TaxID=2608089 RepID=UPI003CCBCF53